MMAGNERGIASSIFGLFRRSKARTAVSLAGIRHKRMRELLVNWCVRMKGEVDELHRECGRFPVHGGYVSQKTMQAQSAHASADRIIAGCGTPDFRSLLSTIEEGLRARGNALDGAARHIDAIRSELGNAPAAGTAPEEADDNG